MMLGLNIDGKDEPTSQSLGGYNWKIIKQQMPVKQLIDEESTSISLNLLIHRLKIKKHSITSLDISNAQYPSVGEPSPNS